MKRWLDNLEARVGVNALVTRCRRLVIGSYAILILMMIYRGVAVESDASRIGPWWPSCCPGALPASILAKRARGHAWLAFVSLLYFAQASWLPACPDSWHEAAGGAGLAGPVRRLRGICALSQPPGQDGHMSRDRPLHMPGRLDPNIP